MIRHFCRKDCSVDNCEIQALTAARNYWRHRHDALEKSLSLANAVCEEAWDCYISGIWREFNLRLLDKWKAHKEKQS